MGNIDKLAGVICVIIAAWTESGNGQKGSFVWACRRLELDVQRVRECLLKVLTK